MQSRNLTIMFTDMKGYTSRTSSNSREQIAALIDEQDRLVLPVIEQHGGRVVKTIGDAYMVAFESPTSAVLCGVGIQKAVEGKFLLRIGINTGEVGTKNGDVFGEPVNLASRVESGAEPGRVFLTEAVYQAMNKNEVKVVEVGMRSYKGIPRQIKVYKVARQGIRGRLESLWPVSYPRVLPLSLVLVGLLVFEWGIYKWRWPGRSLAEVARIGEGDGVVLGEESSEPDNDSSLEMLREEFLRIMGEATKSAIVVEVTPKPEPSVSPKPTIFATPTVTLTPTPTPTVEERSRRGKKPRDDDD